MVYFSVTLPKKFCSDTCSFCLHVPVPWQKQMYPKDDWLVNWCLTSQREYFTYFTHTVRYLEYVGNLSRERKSMSNIFVHVCLFVPVCFIFYEVLYEN